MREVAKALSRVSFNLTVSSIKNRGKRVPQNKQELLLGSKGADSFKELTGGLRLFICSSTQQISMRQCHGAKHETKISKSNLQQIDKMD